MMYKPLTPETLDAHNYEVLTDSQLEELLEFWHGLEIMTRSLGQTWALAQFVAISKLDEMRQIWGARFNKYWEPKEEP